jgi:hypothetical protein
MPDKTYCLEPGLEVRGADREWSDYLVHTPRTAGFHWIDRDAWRLLQAASGRTSAELVDAELARAPQADPLLVRRRVTTTVAALADSGLLHAQIAGPVPNQ